MVRGKSGQSDTIADWTYPVRMRVFIPKTTDWANWSRRYDVIYQWLDTNAGKRRYWVGSGNGTGKAPGSDCLFVYVASPDIAAALVKDVGISQLVKCERHHRAVPFYHHIYDGD